jgi:hypothetical protein
LGATAVSFVVVALLLAMQACMRGVSAGQLTTQKL